jgi:hypothetical protein
MPSIRGARLFLLLLAPGLLALSSPLIAAPIRITGRVSDEKAGLSGARLELFPAYEGYADAVRRLTERTGPVPLAKAITDKDGAFEILVPESGCFRVVVRAEGYLAEEIAILPLVEDVELPSTTLMRASLLEVRTVGPDGRPLAGIEVEALDSSPFGRGFPEIRWRWVRPHAVSDREGRVSLPTFKLYGRPTVAATSPRFLGQTATGSDDSAVTLRLIPARAGWIEARGADGKPVPGALARWNGWPVGITGPDGRLEITIPDGEPALTLESREGWQAQVVRTQEKGILPVRLEPPLRIAGRIVDSLARRRVAGAVVWSGSPLAAPAVRSDTSGAFLIEVPAAGESWLEAGAAGFLPSERQLAKKGAGAPAVVTLAPAAALSGIVVDSGGRPVAGARITLSYMKARQGISMMARSRADGGFRFTGLPPGGAFELWATRSGFARSTATARTAPAGQPSPLARIVMADGQTAFGRVVDEGGRPVEGAELLLSNSFLELPLEAASDAEGRFAFRHLSPGKISLMAAHPGYAPGFLKGIEIPPEAPGIDLGDVKLPAAEAIEGRVTDSRGAPIAGAEVKVYPEMSNFSGGLIEIREGEEEPLRTGLDGIFRAERLEGGKRYNLMVQHAGYADTSLPGVQAPTTEPLRIEMKVARNLSGQVVGPEGEPVAGASLTRVEAIRRAGGWGGSMEPLGTTDADGRFRVSGLSSGPVSLQVTAEGYAPRSIEGLQIPEDKDLEDVRITLSRGSVLDVRVLTAEGEPVAGAWVHTSPEERLDRPNPMFLDQPGRDRTDSAGRCRLTLPEAGTFQVSASGPGSSAMARVTAGPGVTPIELRFPAGAEVSGRVIGEDGTGIAGASIHLEQAGNRRGTNTGPDGTFILSTVPDGVYRLKATWKELTTDSLDVTVAGSPVRGLELRLDRPAERRAVLTGHLLGLAPEELLQTRVNAHKKEGGELQSTSPNREGVYRVEGLEPGEWEVSAWVSGRQAHGAVQIPAGAVEATLDLEFRKGFNLTGRVLVDGKPLPGAEVEAWGKEHSVTSAHTAYDGSFVIRGLAAGTVTLVIASTQGLAGSREVHVTEDQEVSIALSTGRLSGRVFAVTGEPVEDAAVTVDAWIPALQTSVSAPGARTGADGAFEIPRVCAGTYKITVLKEGFTPAEATAEVPPGGSSPLVEVVLKPREEGPP